MSGPGKIPQFIRKLRMLVDSFQFSEIVSWSESGYSFIIFDSVKFSQDVLPSFYKHNNLSSFVRQLNMYGFKKVTNIHQSNLRSAPNNEMEFEHAFFVRDNAELLEFIKRKPIENAKKEQLETDEPKDIQKFLEEFQEFRSQNARISSDMVYLRKENEALWKQVSHLRNEHAKQTTLMNKLVKFLFALVDNRKGLNTTSLKQNLRALEGLEADDQPPPAKRTRLPLPLTIEEVDDRAINTAELASATDAVLDNFIEQHSNSNSPNMGAAYVDSPVPSPGSSPRIEVHSVEQVKDADQFADFIGNVKNKVSDVRDYLSNSSAPEVDEDILQTVFGDPTLPAFSEAQALPQEEAAAASDPHSINQFSWDQDKNLIQGNELLPAFDYDDWVKDYLGGDDPLSEVSVGGKGGENGKKTSSGSGGGGGGGEKERRRRSEEFSNPLTTPPPHPFL